LVLADIRREAVDLTVCLGDVATLGPKPRECLEMVRSEGIRSIMGNHDEFLLDHKMILQYNTAPAVLAGVDWTRSELPAADLTFLRGFEREMDVPVGDGRNLRLFHGSPRSHMEMILATTSADELDEMLDGRSGTVLAGGHTHVQMLRQHKGQLVLNAGSVGMPFAEHSRAAAARGEAPRIMSSLAEYTIVSMNGIGIRVDLRRIEVPAGKARAIVLDSAMPMREIFAAQYV